MKVAVLLTCFNRKQKTLSCLRSLFEAKKNSRQELELHVFLTDDGCVDGTVDSVRAEFCEHEITILSGDGSLFWAGGMRLAWKEAIRRRGDWDAYLLINDDTVFMPDMFDELFKTEEYCLQRYGLEGIVSGITCSKYDHSKVTYGGDVWVNKYLGTRRRLQLSPDPQMCDMANANILLVRRSVVDKIGIFDEVYIHGVADFDYTVRAREHDIPVLITSRPCGICDDDHDTEEEKHSKVLSLSLSDRKKYFSFPPRSGKDHLAFIKRHVPIRYPMVVFGRMLELYWPELYYRINRVR